MGRCFPLLLLLVMIGFTSCNKSGYILPGEKSRIEKETINLKGISENIGSNIGGYFVALPGSYDKSSQSYPVIFFMHGAGQFGNGDSDLPNLLSEGIPALLDAHEFPEEVVLENRKYSFLIFAPQFKSYPLSIDIQNFVDEILKKYRIDPSRIYFTGFSLGGRIATDFVSETNTKIAAVVSMAGASNTFLPERGKRIADQQIAVWSFHNEQDQLVAVDESRHFIESINSFTPFIKPRLTIFSNSNAVLKHDAWSVATDPAYKENGMNIYEWMLRFTRH